MFSIRKNRNNIVIAAIALMIGVLWFVGPSKWLVLDENTNKIVLTKQNSPTIVMAIPANSEMYSNIGRLVQISRQVKPLQIEVAALMPAELDLILETIESVKARFDFTFKIYLAPKTLWHRLFKTSGADMQKSQNLKAKYIFIKNNKVLTITNDLPQHEQIQRIEKIFGKTA